MFSNYRLIGAAVRDHAEQNSCTAAPIRRWIERLELTEHFLGSVSESFQKIKLVNNSVYVSAACTLSLKAWRLEGSKAMVSFRS